MTRDRLPALKAALLNHSDSDEEVTISIPNDGDAAMAVFFKEVEDIRSKLEIIEDKITLANNKQKDILALDAALDEKLKVELNEITDDIKSLISVLKKQLSIMGANVDGEEERNNTSATFRIQKIQYSSLSQKFVGLISIYSANQIKHHTNCKERMKKELKIVGSEYSDAEMEEMLETGKVEIFIQNLNMDTKKAKDLVSDLKSRHNELLKLENSIRELHDTFQEIGYLVNEQGLMLDRIENQVTNTKEYVEDAKNTTKNALELQRSARKKKIICIVIVVIVLLVIILIVALTV